MANLIKPKRTNTAGKVPTTSDLASGEFGVNMADKKSYINNGSAIVQIGAGELSGLSDTSISAPTNGQVLAYNGSAWVNQSGGGTGDVIGPAGATDNALVRFDGTTGKIIQNGTVTQDDNGSLGSVNAISFDTTPTSAPTTQGTMAWDNGNSSPSIVLNSDVSLQLGQEQLALVYNGTGSTIANGSVVAVAGAQGQRPSVVLADADSESTSASTLGIATQDIANGAEGFVTTFGFVRGINTSGFTAGAPVYLSQTAGGFTATRPSAPAHTVALGWVIKVNASSGEIFVNINNGWELDELHNVLITSPASGNTLIYDAVTGVWKNANLTDGTGISITEGAGSITIANTGVTSVGMTVPTGLSVSGTPVTTTGTLAISYAAGYSIPTTASQTNWDTAYSDRLKWDGGSTGLVAATGRTSLGATTVGGNMFTLTNPSAVTFPRFNADNTVSALDAATFRSAIGAGTGSGTVTGVTATSPVASSGGTAPVISLASGYGDTQNPYASKTANYILAAPNGVAGAPTFRAMVAADVPTLNQNTTGTAGGLSGTPNISVGTVSASGVVTSTVATGTAPFTIASTTLNTNLNADLLDGNHASAFYLASNPSSYIALSSAITGYTVGTNTALAATDTLLASLGKIQGQINARGTGTVTSVTGGSYLTGGTITTSGTLAVDATSANTASKVVARDASGNFSAGTITATLNGNASTATSATSATSATNASNTTGGNQTGSYEVTQGQYNRWGASAQTDGNDGKIGAGLFGSGLNIVGTQTTAGTGRQVRIWGSVITDSGVPYVYNSGTWDISVTGNAATATTANALNASNSYTAVAFTATSDERLKTNWQDVDPQFIEKLANVKHGVYDRVDVTATQMGVSAQSLQNVAPKGVFEADGVLSVAYGNVALVAAIKLAQEVIELRKEIEELKKK